MDGEPSNLTRLWNATSRHPRGQNIPCMQGFNISTDVFTGVICPMLELKQLLNIMNVDKKFLKVISDYIHILLKRHVRIDVSLQDGVWFLLNLESYGRHSDALLPKSEARSKYRVTPKQLSTLSYIKEIHPRHNTVYLYKISDILTVSLQRFGSSEKLREYQAKLSYRKNEKLRKREEEWQREADRISEIKRLMEERRVTLVRGLEVIKVPSSSYPELATAFIQGGCTEFSIDEIVNRCAQVHYLLYYAGMKAVLNRLEERRKHDLSEVVRGAQNFDTYYRPRWDDVDITDLAKKEMGEIVYPDKWPWLD